jgi:acylglycerol lipase
LKDANFSIDYDGDDFEVKVGEWTLRGQSWTKNVEKPKFIYVFVHGLTAMATFKRDFYPVINEAGGVVFACDHVGHGRSPGPHVSCRIDEVVEETKQVVALAVSRFSSLPVIIHGHSLGALSIISLTLRFPEYCATNIAGIIAEAPWISPSKQRSVGCCTMAGARILNYILPTFHINMGVDFFSPDEDERWDKIFREFPFRYTVITPRTFVSVVDEQAFIRSNIDLYPKDVPLLFMQGLKDDLVTPEMNEFWIQRLINDIPDADITYKRFDEGSHVVLKTPLRGEAIHAMLSFIKRILQKH